eukprot:5773344-Alexandrium_andersonii.AAC.1
MFPPCRLSAPLGGRVCQLPRLSSGTLRCRPACGASCETQHAALAVLCGHRRILAATASVACLATSCAAAFPT